MGIFELQSIVLSSGRSNNNSIRTLHTVKEVLTSFDGPNCRVPLKFDATCPYAESLSRKACVRGRAFWSLHLIGPLYPVDGKERMGGPSMPVGLCDVFHGQWGQKDLMLDEDI
jgi:hypothetical protein